MEKPKEPNELKPCPFCGGEPEIDWGYYDKDGDWIAEDWCWIKCMECGVVLCVEIYDIEEDGKEDVKSKTIERWNKRA